MAQVINIIISMIPFGSLAAAPVQLALFYWDRMSEFTADRAGLLCCLLPEQRRCHPRFHENGWYANQTIQ